MIQSVIDSLGPNKVTVPFQESSRFVQGNTAYAKSYPYSFQHPFKLFETQYKERKTSGQPNLSGGSVICKEDAILYQLMVYLTPMSSLPSDKASTLNEFRCELVRNLSNEKQLYKMFGFSKKKTCTIEDLTKAIMEPSVEKSADAMTYLSKLAQSRIIIVDIKAMTRADYVHGDSCILFDYDGVSAEYKYIDNVKTLEECNRYILAKTKDTLPPSSSLKLNEAKTIVKFLSGNSKTATTKAEVLAELEALKN
jgi:hypothetical protein